MCQQGTSSQDGDGFICGNKELAIAALNLLDGAEDQMQWESKLNLKDIEKENVQQNDAEEPFSVFVTCETAIVLLGETTQNGFN